MDYRRFLGQTSHEVLPYFGGSRVVSGERSLRVKGSATAGWWSFQISGRFAEARERAEAPDLSRLPRQLGHWVRGWLFSPGQPPRRLFLPPPGEPELFTPVCGRVWHDGTLLFDCVEFESEIEEQVRLAVEERRSLAGVKGVGSGLREAFAYAVSLGVSERLGVAISPRELQGQCLLIAQAGQEHATRWLQELEARRETERQRLRRQQPVSVRRARIPVRNPGDEPRERAERALAVAGAELLRCRAFDERLLEVGFRFLDERFVSLVDRQTLQVFDAGICLDGEDKQVNLDSLPSVIREAIDRHALHITRHF